MKYKFGEILFTDVPFRDIALTKRRPVMVVVDGDDDDVVVNVITSQNHGGSCDVAIKDWASAGLKTASFVRIHKFFTQHKKRIYGRLGQLSIIDTEKIRAQLLKLIEKS